MNSFAPPPKATCPFQITGTESTRLQIILHSLATDNLNSRSTLALQGNYQKLMEEEKLDLISSLPFELQQRIISFLPLKEAVRASVLSTRWKSLWSPIQVSLNFDPNPINHEGSVQEFNQVMGMCMRSYACLGQWKLCLNVVDSNEALILKATKGVDTELHLEFFETKKVSRDFKSEPTSTSACLCLHSHHPTQTDSFSGVKLLHLRSVTNLTKTLVSEVFSNCHVLESLKLEKCRGLESLDVKTDSLRSLVVADCSNMAAITISAQNIKSFWFHGALPQIITLKNTRSLIDVVLNLKDGPISNEFDCEEILSILFSFKDVEALTLSGWLLEWLCSAGVIFGRLDFQFNKLKALTWIDSLINKDKRDSLACFLNACPLLEKLSVEIDSNLSTIPCPLFYQYWHEPHLWMDFTSVTSNTSQLKHLKSIELLGFTGRDHELQLMDLLLEKAIRVNSLTLTCPEFLS
ncbi:hypothetical protein CerSpe_223930 [Prunus speciosa]